MIQQSHFWAYTLRKPEGKETRVPPRFIAALFIIARTWKQPRCPSADEWIRKLWYSFSYLEPVCCSMSSSNCCFLTCIQISQEAGQVVWYSHLLKNFPQFIVIQTVKGFGIVNKADIDVFSGTLLLFSMIQRMLAI